MSRQDQWAISLSIDGTPYGIWDKLSGGEIDSEELKYKPGNMGAAVSLGGSVEVGNLTVSRLFMLPRDHDLVQRIIARVGKATCTVSRQPLDVDGNAYGKAIVYTAKLKTTSLPEIDSESSDAALLELELTPGGTVTFA